MKPVIGILAGLMLWGCSFASAYYPVKAAEGYGVIDARGNLVLAPQKYVLEDFGAEEVAWFRDPSPDAPYRFGLMHVSGRVLVPPKYHNVEPFSEGLAWACTYADPDDRSNDLWTVVDRHGRERFESRRYRAVFEFEDGVSWVDVWDREEGGLHTVIDSDGRAIYRPHDVWGVAGIPQEGLVDFYVMQEGHADYRKIGFVDRAGRFVIEPQFSDTGRFSEGRCWVRIGGEPGEYGRPRGGRLGFIDRKGRWLFDVQADAVSDFSGGRSAVIRGKKYGFVDEKGTLVIPAVFDAVMNFSDGLAPARTAAGWGAIDRQGAWVIEPHFFEMGSLGFQKGLIHVFLNRPTGDVGGWIDGRGHWVFPPGVPAHTLWIRGPLMPIVDQFNDPVAYADLQGRYVWPPEKRGQPVASDSTDPRDRWGQPAR